MRIELVAPGNRTDDGLDEAAMQPLEQGRSAGRLRSSNFGPIGTDSHRRRMSVVTSEFNSIAVGLFG